MSFVDHVHSTIQSRCIFNVTEVFDRHNEGSISYAWQLMFLACLIDCLISGGRDEQGSFICR